MVARSAARSLVAAALALVVVTLTGCTATTHATASATASPVGTPIRYSCNALLKASALDVYGQRFHRVAGAKPRSGSSAATIAAQRGRVCVYRSAKGTTITLAVARLPKTASTRLKNTLYEHSHSVPTYSFGSTYVEGYFLKKAGVGRADAFPDPYWVNVRSTLLNEPGAASPIIDAVRAVLVPDGSSTTASPSPTPTN